MTKTEIERRLETLDKLEKLWRDEGFGADKGIHKCLLCIEAGQGCFRCTYKMMSGLHCCGGSRGNNGFLLRARRRHSIRPVTKAIRKMRTWLKSQEGK